MRASTSGLTPCRNAVAGKRLPGRVAHPQQSLRQPAWSAQFAGWCRCSALATLTTIWKFIEHSTAKAPDEFQNEVRRSPAAAPVLRRSAGTPARGGIGLRLLATSVRSPGAGHGLYQSSVDSIDTETGSAYRSTPMSQRSSITTAMANNITENFVTVWLLVAGGRRAGRFFCRRLREMIRSSEPPSETGDFRRVLTKPPDARINRRVEAMSKCDR